MSIGEQNWEAVKARFGLSDRELDVLQWLLAGLTEKEVAARLALSPHTVHTYLRRVAKKLGAGSRAALVTRTIEILLVVPYGTPESD